MHIRVWRWWPPGHYCSCGLRWRRSWTRCLDAPRCLPATPSAIGWNAPTTLVTYRLTLGQQTRGGHWWPTNATGPE